MIFKKFKTEKKSKSEKGFSLLSVVFAMLALSAVGAGMTSTLSVKSQTMVKDYEGNRTFYIADSGMQYVLAQEFFDSADFTTASAVSDKAFANGTFSASYSDVSATSAKITVVSVSGESTRQLQQTVARVQNATGALHSGGNISLENSQSATGDITGNILYGGSYNNEGAYTVTGTVAGGDNPDSMTLQTLINMTSVNQAGDLDITTDYANDIHVTGNVAIDGQATVSGVIVADGDITVDMTHSEVFNFTGSLAAGGNIFVDFSHDSQGTFSPVTLGGTTWPVVFAIGNIDFEQHQDSIVTINGLLRSGGNTTLSLYQNDIMNLNGAIIAGGNIVIDVRQNTQITIDYPAGSASVGTTFTLTNWKEL